MSSPQTNNPGGLPLQFFLKGRRQQALYIIGDVLVDPGDIVIAANPSYFVYTGTLQSLGAKVMTVPMDDGGMDVEAVRPPLAPNWRARHPAPPKVLLAAR